MTTYALFIGIDRYGDRAIRNLRHAHRDAQELYGLFKNGLQIDHAALLDGDTGLKQVKSALNGIGSAVEAGDRFIFYYAGHGYWHPGKNDTYLLLPEARRRNVEAGHTDGEELLSLKNLKFEVDGWPDVESLFILDACRSALGEETARGASETVFQGEDLLVELFPRLPRPARDAFDEGGTMVLNACGNGQAAFEPGEEGEGGLLRLALEAEIRQVLNDGRGLTIDRQTPQKLAEHIRVRWGRESPQQPWLSPADGRFVLTRPTRSPVPISPGINEVPNQTVQPPSSAPVEPPPIIVSAKERDERNWRLACLEDTVEAYKQYVKDALKGSPHVNEAFTRIKGKLETAKVSGGNTPPTQDYAPLSVFRDRLSDGSLGPEMVVIPAGEFDMGSDEGISDEKPIHKVQIANAFALGKYPVTQAQWRQVMGADPSHFKGCDDCPVENVSWNDVQDFIKKLKGLTGKSYRLPSEPEWEYAATAGGKNSHLYSDGENLDAVAWYRGNSDDKTHPVGQKQANAWGLYDMGGNVTEWMEDVWHSSYQKAPTDGSAWTSNGATTLRVVRGGSWYNRVGIARAALRSHHVARFGGNSTGFRLARTLP